ncbi:zinc finger protein 277 isoform X2 [Parasteatoda tepidariorum]|uniref:zinc finger protein 277 isoform X2 n=1 Tax=Parasteatoda tepidariorum TaxID=114398 RepID=UPI0039BD7E85
MDQKHQFIEHKIKTLNLASSAASSMAYDSIVSVSNSAEYYYSLLSSAPRDKEVQKQLQQQRLKFVLDELQREREDSSFSRNCLFCSKHFTGNKTVILDHLRDQHNFVIGAPDNIVFIKEYLDHLETLLKSLQCFYCEKVFKDLMTLKEHMRKKQHKRVNPQNQFYDKFYVINYLELGKTWVDIQEEDDRFYQDGNEKISVSFILCYDETNRNRITLNIEIMDWEDDRNLITCLFCENKLEDFDETLQHMKDEHRFDFRFLKQAYQLDFYKQIKLINYIRKKVYEKECTFCDSKFIVPEDLLEHMMETGHIANFPNPSNWDQPMYFFPTFENDNLLCALDADDVDSPDCIVVPEDTTVPNNNVLAE